MIIEFTSGVYLARVFANSFEITFVRIARMFAVESGIVLPAFYASAFESLQLSIETFQFVVLIRLVVELFWKRVLLI